MKKSTLKAILSVVVMGIGVYMLWNNAWPTPPALSGLALLILGYINFMPHCPVCKMICKG